MDSHNDEYELKNASNLVSCDVPLAVCGLCGITGKVFMNFRENEELLSKINKYMPFIDMQNNFSDSICYPCSSQINSWNGFYLNCSSVNSKLNKESTIPEIRNFDSNEKQKNMSNMVYGYPVDQINYSYNRLEENPCTENIACTMDVLSDCLKSLINQLKTSSSSSTVLCEETLFDGNEEYNMVSSEFCGFLKPVDVIEVDIAESDTAFDLKNKPKLKRIQKVMSKHGVLLYDEDGYAYRINKKQSGKAYVRCSIGKCPVRGTVLGSSFRSNKLDHTHPPQAPQRIAQFAESSRSFKTGKSLPTAKEKVKEVWTSS